MRRLPDRAHLLNALLEQRDATRKLLLERAASLSLANVRALKWKHAALCRRIARLEEGLR